MNGKRAYEYARKGEVMELKVREAHISRYDVDNSKFPKLSFHIECSKGTYIRSLARDLGVALESGAYMSSLVRTMIGNYHVDDAVNMVDIVAREDFFKHAKQFNI